MLRVLSVMPIGFSLLSLSGVSTNLGAGGLMSPVVFAHLGGFIHECMADGAGFGVGHLFLNIMSTRISSKVLMIR